MIKWRVRIGWRFSAVFSHVGVLLVTHFFMPSCVSSESEAEETMQNEEDASEDAEDDEEEDSANSEDDEEEDSANANGNQAEESDAESGVTPGASKSGILMHELELPEFIERVDLDQFLIRRRTLYADYLPLDKKFEQVNAQFARGTMLDRQAEENLKNWLRADLRRSHWVFLKGLLIALEKLGDRTRPLLKEQQKTIIVQHTKTLSFIAGVLDETTKTKRYKAFVKQVYRSLASRYLYREVRARPGLPQPPSTQRHWNAKEEE